MKVKTAEYLIYFFEILFVLNWFGFFFVFSSFGEILMKISATLFLVLGVMCFILASILAKREKKRLNNEYSFIY